MISDAAQHVGKPCSWIDAVELIGNAVTPQGTLLLASWKL